MLLGFLQVPLGLGGDRVVERVAGSQEVARGKVSRSGAKVHVDQIQLRDASKNVSRLHKSGYRVSSIVPF